MNAKSIKQFAAENGLHIVALHDNGEATDRDLTEGRDREDLGRIWAEPAGFILERPCFRDLLDPNPIFLLKTLI